MKKIVAVMMITFSSPLAFAQSTSDELEVINLEDLYKSEAPAQSIETQVPRTTVEGVQESNSGLSTNELDDETVGSARAEEKSVKELKDLNQLIQFSDLSIIQKKFLPKTERLELYIGAGLTTNTPWFTNYGGKLNLSYNFTETFGLEVNTLFLTSSKREVAKEIHENNNLTPDQFIYTKGYYGLDLKFSPVYGKISWKNQNIIHYEMYFSAGGGVSSTNSVEKNVTTIHAGIGQLFALSKGMAFRWDYSANFFQATPMGTGSTGGAVGKGSYNDLVLTAGFSFFFPEAGYR